MFLFPDAAALLLTRENLKQKNKSIVEIELQNQELLKDKTENQKLEVTNALRLEDLGKLNYRAERELDHIKQNRQTLHDEIRKLKEELEHSATVLGNTIQQNNEEKGRLNDEIYLAKLTIEALRSKMQTNPQELDRTGSKLSRIRIIILKN